VGVRRPAYLVDLPAPVPYLEALELQRSLAGAVSQGAIPDTVILLEHPPVITLGRRAEPGELHVPDGAEVEIVETDRGGKSTYHAPGQLVCYPILDLARHGQDVKKYCRDLEEALVKTLAPLGIEAKAIEGLTGLWVNATRPSHPRKIASIGVHIHKWVTTHGYALNVDLDPAPFTEWITACGLDGASFTTVARELDRPITVDDVRPVAAAALAETFGLELEPIPSEDGHGLWAQPIHTQLAASR
jgi:lipoyl(octanoyl) transferase